MNLAVTLLLWGSHMAIRACLAARNSDPAEASALRLNLVRGAKHVNGHVIAAACPILDRRGALLATRSAADAL
ncbi:hypothetical protein GJ654_01365 [Rhodoblastus acidophilus]|uniref:Uncharacterized protein n=1 Tax=Rhodoblastus acidophilus TaxID=1074 RepID=A0A6N8DIM8_RHOAC|nr:hypothetical protein [Rhodoblastus acidophilus]MCW2272725.1 hypothetical protein [Rhodoblastus acidophilus]MTV29636.1 hypothetical protein [Rhodoblastus acidophilus]